MLAQVAGLSLPASLCPTTFCRRPYVGFRRHARVATSQLIIRFDSTIEYKLFCIMIDFAELTVSILTSELLQKVSRY